MKKFLTTVCVLAACISGCGVNGANNSVVTVDNTPWVFSQNYAPGANITTPITYREYTTTTASNYNSGAGTQTFEFTFRSTGYFENNPNGHFAIVLRCNNSAIANGYVQGQGIVIGNVSGATTNNPPPGVPYSANPSAPSTQVESWWNGLNPYYGNTLLSNTNGADPVLSDGVDYRFTVTSRVLPTGESQTGFKIKQGNTIIYEQPMMRDYNTWYDRTKTGILIVHAFPTENTTWSVIISDKKITWSPYF